MVEKSDTNTFKVSNKVFFRVYKDGKETWKNSIIAATVGKLVNMMKGKKFQHKRH